MKTFFFGLQLIWLVACVVGGLLAFGSATAHSATGGVPPVPASGILAMALGVFMLLGLARRLAPEADSLYLLIRKDGQVEVEWVPDLTHLARLEGPPSEWARGATQVLQGVKTLWKALRG